MEHDEQAEQMEHEADRMEHDSEQVGERIDDTRRDWEAKEQDPAVPGAQPDPAEEEESAPGVQVDEETVAEEGTATGNPDAAGAEEPGSGEE